MESDFDASTFKNNLKQPSHKVKPTKELTIIPEKGDVSACESDVSWKEAAVNELSPTEIFFDTTFNTFVLRFRFFIIVASFALAGYAGFRSTEV